MYELVLVLVPPDERDPLARADELISPYLYRDDRIPDDEYSEMNEEGPEAEGHQGSGDEPPYWDSADVGWRGKGRLWWDRYGNLPDDHPITKPADEIRRAGEIDSRATMLVPSGLVTPDGELHPLGESVHRDYYSLADYAEYEDRLAAHADHLAVPMRCHWLSLASISAVPFQRRVHAIPLARFGQAARRRPAGLRGADRP
jgi:hypothetical protein